MNLETVRVSDLKPLEKNVRRHVQRQIDAFCKSLEQFGQTRAFVIDEDNNILVGNGMYQAMMQAGWETASAYRITNLTDKQKKKLVLSDNRVFSLGIDEYQVMNDMLKELAIEGDFDVAGYDAESLKLLVADVGQLQDVAMSYGTMQPQQQDAMQRVYPGTGQAEERPAYAPQPSQPIPPIQPSAAAVTRTIICPNCGEVISL